MPKEHSGASDAEPSRLRKRSVTIAGHRTSVSLEEAFWDALFRIAKARGQSVSEVIADIDRRRSGNLSSAIRVFVLAEIEAAAGAGGSTS